MTANSSSRIAVFGSTGSIGTATLDVLASLDGQQANEPVGPFEIVALTANSRWDLLEQQVAKHKPAKAVLTCPESAATARWPKSQARTECLVGADKIVDIAQSPDVDIVVAAIVGSAGLAGALAAAESGKRIALANKEALVVAGPIMMKAAAENRAEILPVDSEHSAIFQALHGRKLQSLAGNRGAFVKSSESASATSLESARLSDQVQRVVLTASGGSLRDWPAEKLDEATVDDALNHPTWSMGRKITIDSATMMNKAFEIIEARWLFDLPAEKISVVIHPQSIIHSMVEFVDGSVLAQLSPPDMKLPIQYALTYPNRCHSPAAKMDWASPMALDWQPVETQRYPALEIGFEVARRGGTTGAAVNAANEVAVEAFLQRKIKFTDIARLNRAVLDNHNFDPSPSLEQLMHIDQWSRDEAHRWAEKQNLHL
jgi:1-deoxy-D-xylulose-5-phosphate reductoisomerase